MPSTPPHHDEGESFDFRDNLQPTTFAILLVKSNLRLAAQRHDDNDVVSIVLTISCCVLISVFTVRLILQTC